MPSVVRVCELDGFIHVAGRGREESRDGLDADTGAARYRSVKRRMRSKSLAECGGAILSDDCNPVVSWCALIHDGIPFVWDASPRRSLRQPQTRCDAEKEIRELSQDRSSFLHLGEVHSGGTNISDVSSDRYLHWLQIPEPQSLQDAAKDCSLECPIRILHHTERFVSAS